MRHRTTASVLAVALLALGGCATSNPDAVEARAFTQETLDDPVVPIGPGGDLFVETFEWGFDIIEGEPVDGAIEVTLDNIGSTLHNFQIDAAAGENVVVEAAAGEQNTGTLQLFAGNYVYYCSIPGHRAQGMEGELTVYATPEEAEEAGVEGLDGDA